MSSKMYDEVVPQLDKPTTAMTDREKFKWVNAECQVISVEHAAQDRLIKVTGRIKLGKFINFQVWDSDTELFAKIRAGARKGEWCIVRGYYNIEKDPRKEWLTAKTFETKTLEPVKRYKAAVEYRAGELVEIGNKKVPQLDFIIDMVGASEVERRIRTIEKGKNYIEGYKKIIAEMLDEAIKLKVQRDEKDFEEGKLATGDDVEKYF